MFGLIVLKYYLVFIKLLKDFSNIKPQFVSFLIVSVFKLDATFRVMDRTLFINAIKLYHTTHSIILLDFQIEAKTVFENIFRLFVNSILQCGKETKAVAVMFSLFSYIKECASKIPLDFLTELLLLNKEPPFLINRFQKSNRTYFFPVPFIEKKKKKKLFFLFLYQPLKKAQNEYRKKYSRRNRIFFSFLMHIYFPETSIYVRTFNDFITFGTNNRMYLHYRWQFKR